MRVANRSLRRACAAAITAIVLAALCTPPAGAGRVRREGDILEIFRNATVYVVTNEDATLADALLEGCPVKRRRVLSVPEWQALPEGARWYFSTVFLINRERLAAGARVPDDCQPEPDEVWTQVTRTGRDWGVAHDVTISAPDAAWLRRAVAQFRSLREPPRLPLRQSVRSIAVVPVGPSLVGVAEWYVTANRRRKTALPHLLPLERYEASAPRIAHADELLLVDRSAAPGPAALPPAVAGLIAARAAGPSETVVWRTPKGNGGVRIVISAPNPDLVAEALRRYPDLRTAPEAPSVVASAPDLRAVRRIAVAGLKNGAGGPDLARRVASLAATQVRALQAFEVLERAGLSEVLSEIALGQAGITRAGDRDRVRQLAAADALLIVEVTDAQGSVQYAPSNERLTPPMPKPPARPPEPSRLRVLPSWPDTVFESPAWFPAETALRSVVGVMTDHEYKQALNRYYNVTLPRWQQWVDEYERRYRNREISWKQSLVARQTAAVSGSLRLVDLADGLVLWEAPFSASGSDASVFKTAAVTSAGEGSLPLPAAHPEASPRPSDAFVARVAESAVARGVQALRSTALLPSAAGGADTASASEPAPMVPPEAPPAAAADSGGRILDVDGDVLLIGLGASDGLRVDDTLQVRLPDNRTVGLVVTRVRPRTCDATFDPGMPADLRALVAVGQGVGR